MRPLRLRSIPGLENLRPQQRWAMFVLYSRDEWGTYHNIGDNDPFRASVRLAPAIGLIGLILAIATLVFTPFADAPDGAQTSILLPLWITVAGCIAYPLILCISLAALFFSTIAAEAEDEDRAAEERRKDRQTERANLE